MTVAVSRAIAECQEGNRHNGEPDELQPFVSDPVHAQDGKRVARDGEHDEDREC